MHLLLKRPVSLMLLLCLGCSAQSTAPDLARRIERQVRFTYEIPEEVGVKVGERKPSEIPGYDQVLISFSQGERVTTHDFLVSRDGKNLVRMSKMDLSVDPYEQLMQKIDVSGRPIRGNPDAKVTVVVYDDFQCPYCSRMHQTLFREVFPAYKERIKVIYKDFPLDFHAWAMRAAVNANCLGAQSADAYWTFADQVHLTPEQITGNNRPLPQQLAQLDAMALKFGQQHQLDSARLQACLKAADSKPVKASLAEGNALGINGTPAIFVNGRKLGGAVPASVLRATLDAALRDAGQPVPAPAQAQAPPAVK